MAGYIGKSQGVTQVDGYTRSEADAEYANIAGDTFTGAVTGTDLTLSGGVYLGGTGSANYLDDYEEGTWTPVDYNGVVSITPYSSSYCTYTKIGRLVHINIYVTVASNSSSNSLQIAGLPVGAANGYYYLSGRIQGQGLSDIVCQVNTGSTYFQVFSNNTGLTYSDVSGKYLILSGVYQTS